MELDPNGFYEDFEIEDNNAPAPSSAEVDWRERGAVT